MSTTTKTICDLCKNESMDTIRGFVEYKDRKVPIDICSTCAIQLDWLVEK